MDTMKRMNKVFSTMRRRPTSGRYLWHLHRSGEACVLECPLTLDIAQFKLLRTTTCRILPTTLPKPRRRAVWYVHKFAKARGMPSDKLIVGTAPILRIQRAKQLGVRP